MEENFLNLTKGKYENLEIFLLNSGSRYGFPLLHLLFNPILQILASKLRKEGKKEGKEGKRKGRREGGKGEGK